jgi:hypothetical protein
MTTRYQIFDTLIIWYQVVIKLFTTKLFIFPWAIFQNYISSKHQLSGRDESCQLANETCPINRTNFVGLIIMVSHQQLAYNHQL